MDVADALVDAVVRAAKGKALARVLLVGADRFPVQKLKAVKSKLVCAVVDAGAAAPLAVDGFLCVVVPPYAADREDRMKTALVAAASAGLVHAGDRVLVALVGENGDDVDALVHLKIGQGTAEHAGVLVAGLKSKVPASLMEVVVDFAIRVGREGYEGRPVGTLLVVGDATRVMEQSHPLTLNPFQGYSESERNLFDAGVREAVRSFAMLDGAFVVREDGVVMAAGRHVRVDAAPKDLPLGYGSRHTAAAAISKQTDCVAVVVSQSSGKVRVFEGGALALEIEPGGRRGTGAEARAGEMSATKPKRRRATKKRASDG